MDERLKPEVFLERARTESQSSSIGKLKIYLGMAAGVGKTYGMLSDALIEKARGVDVVAGYIEPHGRAETDALVSKFEQLPFKNIGYRGIQLNEFDLDAALARKPSLILVDELAHTNATGLRHTKRWQDIQELLNAGIHVYTTLNIQHLESLKDVVHQITGIEVKESVPDSFLKSASEVELVDATPEELIQRLESGKIYTPDKIDNALKNFFQKGNLVALREIVLRHTADSIDSQLRILRRAQGVESLWPAAPRVLVAVGPTTFAPKLVRAASRFAHSLRADLVAAHISLPHLTLLPHQQAQVEQALALAERLGAATIQTSASDISTRLIELARERNANVIVIGKPIDRWWNRVIRRSPVDELIRKSGDIDIHVMRVEKDSDLNSTHQKILIPIGWKSLLLTLSVISCTTAICFLLYPYLELSNLVMIYLLSVAWTAARYGRRAAGLAALCNVLIFDFCFVPPRWTFGVSDVQYLITFAVMLIIGILISDLTSRGRAQAEAITERENRTNSLYELSKRLAAAQNVEEIQTAADDHISRLFHARALIFLHDDIDGLITISSAGNATDSDEKGVATWVSQQGRAAGRGTNTLPGAQGLYLALATDALPCSVLGIYLPFETIDRSNFEMLEAISFLIGTSLTRVLRTREAQETQVRADREATRNLLLSSVSHDLRTPLAAIAGSASVILEDRQLSKQSRELAQTIGEQTTRLENMVRNVLDITRLESGHLQLKREWQSIEELIGAALEVSSLALGSRKVNISLADSMPLIKVDALLIQQLLVNLFENISKYTPETTQIHIKTWVDNAHLFVEILDTGPGFPFLPEREQLKTPDCSTQGTRLGLNICRAIVSAHDGKMLTENEPSGGARVLIRLPIPQEQPHVING